MSIILNQKKRDSGIFIYNFFLMVIFLTLLLFQPVQAEQTIPPYLWKYQFGNARINHVSTIVMSPDGENIAVVLNDNEISLLNQYGNLLWNKKMKDRVNGIAVSSDDQLVVAGFGDIIYLFDQNGDILWNNKMDDWKKSIAISSNGQYFVIGSSDPVNSNVFYYNKNHELLWKYQTSKPVSSIAISSDGQYIAIGSGDFIYLFNQNGSLVWKYQTTKSIWTVAISSDGKHVVAGSYDNYLLTLNQNGDLTLNKKLSQLINNIIITDNGDYIASGGYSSYPDSIIYFVKPDGIIFWHHFDYDQYSISSNAAISSNGQYAILPGSEGRFGNIQTTVYYYVINSLTRPITKEISQSSIPSTYQITPTPYQIDPTVSVTIVPTSTTTLNSISKISDNNTSYTSLIVSIIISIFVIVVLSITYKYFIRNTKEEMISTKDSENYDVALSFAGEDRRIVDPIAKILKNKMGINVFYDDFNKEKLWGKHLPTHLYDLYKNRAKYVVIFYSKYYHKKIYTKVEERGAIDKATEKIADFNYEYVLPVKLDNEEIPDPLGKIGYVNYHKENIQELCNLIKKKLDEIKHKR
ncbi:PQQ-binding-like beta-propeller repeat protein [uncultured Methanoregula sp.]|uniref:outer membrane protein assembly factor BamB family protein n=1 Tax=uncultured Methanoregula sp. TaxID=1005933 RepID=UPI002AAB4E09|nr:PQQ-binding-like beta-propeller repeat protein [uncultured Methanoregula sp.]